MTDFSSHLTWTKCRLTKGTKLRLKCVHQIDDQEESQTETTFELFFLRRLCKRLDWLVTFDDPDGSKFRRIVIHKDGIFAVDTNSRKFRVKEYEIVDVPRGGHRCSPGRGRPESRSARLGL